VVEALEAGLRVDTSLSIDDGDEDGADDEASGRAEPTPSPDGGA
jgi:hypothetical protein